MQIFLWVLALVTLVVGIYFIAGGWADNLGSLIKVSKDSGIPLVTLIKEELKKLKKLTKRP